MSKKTLSLVLGALLLVIISGVIFTSISNNETKAKNEAQVEKIEKPETDKKHVDENNEKLDTANFSREGAVNALTSMFKEMKVSPVEGKDLKWRMDEVSKEKYNKEDIFTNKAWDAIRLVDFMKKDPRGEKLAAQSLLSVIHTIDETGNEELVPMKIDYSGVVFFDEEMKEASIPLDLYTNSPTSINIDLKFVNNEWKLEPHSLVAQIAIMNIDKAK